MLKKIYGLLISHIAYNPGTYCVLLFFLISGIIVGSVYGASFENDSYLSEFFSGLSEYSSSVYVKECLVKSFFITLIIFISGVSPVGCVVIPVIMGYKGFVTGYTVAAFVSSYGLKSVVFIILGILPSAFFWIPSYMFGSASGMITSGSFLKILRRRSANDIPNEVSKLFISSVILFLGVILSGFTEIYIIPKMLNIVGGLYT